ncbi:MAG TPA: ribonucleoside-diphosphate reductase, adenosylcobalamin-dependent, partial [Dongiaceae bacterium]|nr:ribonucleoside-diphosphate reductase, adenosylcobalamin-dependent [Dongiaceae bacterium]
LLAAIGDVIEQHMITIGFMGQPEKAEIALRKVVNLPGQRLPTCPKCSQPSLIRQEGCDLCTSCGYSKCS